MTNITVENGKFFYKMYTIVYIRYSTSVTRVYVIYHYLIIIDDSLNYEICDIRVVISQNEKNIQKLISNGKTCKSSVF